MLVSPTHFVPIYFMKKQFFAFVLLFLSTSASAATFTVTTLSDFPDASINGTCDIGGGLCSLRAAIQEANNTPAVDTILLPDSQYLLNNTGAGEDLAATGDLDILAPLIIQGESAYGTIINGLTLDGIFQVINDVDFTISDLTLQNGYTSGTGGAIFFNATSNTLTIDNVNFLGNYSAGAGGAVFAVSDKISINDCYFENNIAFSVSDLYMVTSSSALIQDSTFSRSVSANSIGAIYSTGAASVTINDSYFYAPLLYTGTGASGLILNNSIITLNDITVEAAKNDIGAIAGLAVIGATDINASNLEIFDSRANQFGAHYFSATNNININGLEVKNNESDVVGGGIFASAGNILTVTDAEIRGNTVINGNLGGAYFSATNTVNISNSLIVDNFTSNGIAGAIITTSGTLNADKLSVIRNHSLAAQVGGLFLAGSNINLTNSDISENKASEGPGGGAMINGSTSILIENTLFADNSVDASYTPASTLGGGLYLEGGANAIIRNSTFSNNFAYTVGGALATSTPTNIENCTFYSNQASAGGAIYNDATTVTLHNNIFEWNQTNSCAGNAMTSAGYNISDDTACNLIGTEDLSSTAAGLLPLSQNGGFSASHLLSKTSPAVDSGDNTNCPATDQRGVKRPLKAKNAKRCDRGAVERSKAPKNFKALVIATLDAVNAYSSAGSSSADVTTALNAMLTYAKQNKKQIAMRYGERTVVQQTNQTKKKINKLINGGVDGFTLNKKNAVKAIKLLRSLTPAA